MKNIYEVRNANKRKSVLVIASFILFVSTAIYFISQAFAIYFGVDVGGIGIAGIALIISGITSFISYYYSDRIILSISRAKPANKHEHFNLYTATENLSSAAGLPMPNLYVIDDSAPNAFATGRDPNHAVVAVTSGLLSKLNRTELEGVIAHELSHVRNYDIRLMSIVSVLVGTIALMADFFLRASFYGRNRDSDRKSGQMGAILLVVGLLFAILSPIIAQLIQLAISRQREFMADAGAVEITRQPGGLISALYKISNDHEPLEVANKATAHLYIINPLKEHKGDAIGLFASMFNTHPPLAKRIAALQKMA